WVAVKRRTTRNKKRSRSGSAGVDRMGLCCVGNYFVVVLATIVSGKDGPCSSTGRRATQRPTRVAVTADAADGAYATLCAITDSPACRRSAGTTPSFEVVRLGDEEDVVFFGVMGAA